MSKNYMNFFNSTFLVELSDSEMKTDFPYPSIIDIFVQFSLAFS